MAKFVKIDENGRIAQIPKWLIDEDEIEALADLWDMQLRDDSDPIEVGVVRRYIRKGNLRKARELLDRLPSTNASLVNLNGVVHELEEEYDLALQCYRLAAELDSMLGAAAFNVKRLTTEDEPEFDNRICL
jgi:hypothetical protein